MRKSLISLGKAFRLFSICNEKPLESLEQGSDMTWFVF